MPVMIRILPLVGLLVPVSALSSSNGITLAIGADGHTRGERAEPPMKSFLLESSRARMGQLQLPAPYFWFWGHVAEILPSEPELLQALPEIVPPSSQPQELTNPNQDSYSQWGQDKILRPILSKVGKGFFVESGARDGEVHSNTLSYELQDGWTGLLIEPEPKAFNALSTKHRHAYAFHGCLSPNGRAETLRFALDPLIPDDPIGDGLGHIDSTGSYRVTSQPLQALMEAIGQPTVDFWSLDIEGSESSVLHTTDFTKVEVGVLLIEMNKAGTNNDGIREVMQREGFHDIGHSNYDKGVLDRIFVNPKYFLKRGLAVPVPEVLDAQFRN